MSKNNSKKQKNNNNNNKNNIQNYNSITPKNKEIDIPSFNNDSQYNYNNFYEICKIKNICDFEIKNIELFEKELFDHLNIVPFYLYVWKKLESTNVSYLKFHDITPYNFDINQYKKLYCYNSIFSVEKIGNGSRYGLIFEKFVAAYKHRQWKTDDIKLDEKKQKETQKELVEKVKKENCWICVIYQNYDKDKIRISKFINNSKYNKKFKTCPVKKNSLDFYPIYEFGKKKLLRYGIIMNDILESGFIQKFVDLSVLHLQKEMDDIEGITTPMTFIGQPYTPFCIHREDCALCSISYMYYGETKIWYIIEEKYIEQLKLLISKFMNVSKKTHICEDIINHKIFFFTIEYLHKNNIRYKKIEQNVGDCIILNSNTLHFGYNCGLNVSVAVNFLPLIGNILNKVFEANSLRNIIKIQDNCSHCSDELNRKNNRSLVVNFKWFIIKKKILNINCAINIKYFLNKNVKYLPKEIRRNHYITMKHDNKMYIGKILDYFPLKIKSKNYYKQILKIDVIMHGNVETILIDDDDISNIMDKNMFSRLVIKNKINIPKNF